MYPIPCLLFLLYFRSRYLCISCINGCMFLSLCMHETNLSVSLSSER